MEVRAEETKSDKRLVAARVSKGLEKKRRRWLI
ncbi:hypothetical protein COLO4_32705 [Corchorus olitorius]|uniref:Uncharacterized protein n=1 Tax=Corchorus olitorius TaxID=93759 RepID=A0A1R3GYC7_9ROSI|nr:hypothetical protein COLO4_32705 [Corchorus olitorius]